MKFEEDFTKYEKARILGARALQIAMNAPILVKMDEKKLQELKYDSLEIAKLEFSEGILPISVKRPMPKRIEIKLEVERMKIEKEEKKDEKIDTEKLEEKEEKEIKEEGEIMELAKSEEDVEEVVATTEEEGV